MVRRSLVRLGLGLRVFMVWRRKAMCGLAKLGLDSLLQLMEKNNGACND